jgi:large subunit ribosomal protein L4
MSAVDKLEVPVKSVSGEAKGHVTIDPVSIDERVRLPLLKEAVVMYGANKRAGTHSTKLRSEIAGSTSKLYRQKGTGRARPGSRKSPLRKGGGVVFGPRPRDYSYAIHRKQRRLATRSALLSKFQDGEVLVVEGLEIPEAKTKRVAAILRALGIERSCLIGTREVDSKLVRASRNIPGVRVAPLKDFNALDILNSRTVLLTRDAFDALVSGEGLPSLRAAAVRDGQPSQEEDSGEAAGEAAGEAEE